MNTENLLQELAKPFSPEHISWKPGSLTKDGSKCMALAYADLRAYQDRLDEVCGLDWSCRFVPWTNNRIICELTIAGITRSSTGESNAQDEKNGMAGSVAEAMSFKRACAGFGCGRFLYDLPSVWIEFDGQAKKISKTGQETLDKRYRDWYKRTTQQTEPEPAATNIRELEKEANTAAENLHRRVAASGNGRAPEPEPKAEPAAEDNPWDDERFPVARLIELGKQIYGDTWPAKSKELAEHVSTGNTQDVSQLNAMERSLLIGGFEKKLSEKQPA